MKSKKKIKTKNFQNTLNVSARQCQDLGNVRVRECQSQTICAQHKLFEQRYCFYYKEKTNYS